MGLVKFKVLQAHLQTSTTHLDLNPSQTQAFAEAKFLMKAKVHHN